MINDNNEPIKDENESADVDGEIVGEDDDESGDEELSLSIGSRKRVSRSTHRKKGQNKGRKRAKVKSVHGRDYWHAVDAFFNEKLKEWGTQLSSGGWLAYVSHLSHICYSFFYFLLKDT